MRVLVAGGGVAAIESVLALHALAGDRVAIDLLAPSGEYVSRPASVESPFSGQPAPHVPLDRLPATAHRGALAAVEPERRVVRTSDGGEFEYDRLIVAVGAHAVESVPGATLFRGPVSAGVVEAAVRAARERVLFVAPADAGWTLPIYELALLAARELPDGPEIAVVTPEPRPLAIFGPAGSDALARLVDRAGIAFIGDTVAREVVGGALVTADGLLAADAVIALPELHGPQIAGLPGGFLEIDEYARVKGIQHVFAAGDVTANPIKQGGLGTQQADAAAEMIAAEAGAPVAPQPIRHVLRAALWTGEAPLILSRDLDAADAPASISRAQLWWPMGKLAGRYLTSFLESGGVPGKTLSDRPRRAPVRPAP
jgi:sulfide:quinone oxidoreductase